MAKKHRVLKAYKSYPFVGQDPVVGKVLAIASKSGDRWSQVSKKSDVSSSAIGRWRGKPGKRTLRPQHATLAAVLGAYGKKFNIDDK